MREIFLSLVAVLAAGCVSTNGVGPANQATKNLNANSRETRTVAFELREGIRVIGKPTITVRLGTPASMSVAGTGGYKLGVTVEQYGTSAGYLVRSSLYQPAGDGWTLVASPSLTIAEGQQTTMVINRIPAPITMLVSVR